MQLGVALLAVSALGLLRIIGIACLLVAVIAIAVRGVVEMRQVNARQLEVLGRFLGRSVIVVTDWGGQIRMPIPIAGVLVTVDSDGVGLEVNGKERFIPLSGIRELHDANGRLIASWS